MINLITLLLRFGLPFIDLIFARSKKKAEMKDKMFELAKKYDEQILKNAKLSKEYAKLREELLK